MDSICESFVLMKNLAARQHRSFSLWSCRRRCHAKFLRQQFISKRCSFPTNLTHCPVSQYLRTPMLDDVSAPFFGPMTLTVKLQKHCTQVRINIFLLDVEHCVFEIHLYLGLESWDCRSHLLFGSVPFGNTFQHSYFLQLIRGIPSQFSAENMAAIASWETWLAWLHSSLNRGTFCLFLLPPFLDWEDGRHFFNSKDERHIFLHITHDIVKSPAGWYRVSWRKWLQGWPCLFLAWGDVKAWRPTKT